MDLKLQRDFSASLLEEDKSLIESDVICARPTIPDTSETCGWMSENAEEIFSVALMQAGVT